jgi:hypothetical protein
MSPFRRRVAVAGVAALALGLGAAGSTIATAAPDTPGTAPTYVPAWLTLTTGATNQVQYVNPAKTGPIPTQTLRAFKGCALNTTPSLLAITSDPASPGVGFSSGGLGVRESTTSAGTSCSAVDSVNGESLILKLGAVDGLVASSASLDIDLKQNARILATATRTKDEVTTTNYFELQSGTNIGAQPAMPGAVVFTCNNASDSGSDNGINNNCRWEISAPSWTGLSEDGVVFDTLTLTALSGSFSLMGGADGYVDDPAAPLPGYFGASGPSVFELVEGTVDCSEGSNTANLRSSSSVPKSTWKRWGNLTDQGTSTDACTAYPYSGTTGINQLGQPFAQFNKPLDFEANAQAIWETTFTYSGNVADPIPDTRPGLPKVYMDLDGDDTGEFELTWCDSSWTVSGVFVGPPNLSAVTNPYACLVSAVAGPKVGPSKSAIYTAYVYGDAQLRR